MKEILQTPGAVIIDVRSPQEFMGGHVAGSRNIPLQQLPLKVEELRNINGPIVLCCASGARSGMAEQMLRGEGFTQVYNGGGWLQVNKYVNNN